MDEDRTQEAINKGHRAASLLNQEAFQEATDYVVSRLMDRWKVSQDTAERERIWHCVGLIEQIKAALNTAYMNGKISRRKLDDLTGRRPS